MTVIAKAEGGHMPDQSTIESVATKFEAWAKGLTPAEQETLAAWWQTQHGGEVTAYTATWWTETGTWAREWTNSWTTTTD
jgi:hypothetical protein